MATPDDLEFIQAFGTPEQKAAAGLGTPEAPKLTLQPTPAPAPMTDLATGAPMQNYTMAIGGDKRTDAERFKQNVADAVPQGLKDFDAAYRQTLSNHPLLNYALNSNPVAGVIGGPKLPPPTNAGPAPQPNAPAPGPVPSAPTPQQAPGKSVDVASLPNAEAPRQILGMGTGPGGGAGLGSDKALQGAQNDVIGGQQALVDKRTEEAGAKVAGLNYAADAKSAEADARRIFAEHQKAVDDQIAHEQADYENKIADEREKASKLGVDPGRVFKNRSAGTWVAMAIGGLMSGALSGLTGQPNSFLDTLKGIQHDDIEAQNKDIDQAWKKVGGMQTTYENLVRRGVDRQVAQNAYLSNVLTSVQGELEARLKRAQLPAEKANLEAGIQSLQNERAAMDVKMQEYWKNIFNQRSAAAASAAAAAAKQRWEHYKELEELRIKGYEAQTHRMGAEAAANKAGGEGDDKANAAFFATGLSPDQKSQMGFLAPSAESRQKLEEANKSYEAAKKSIEEMRRIRGERAGGAIGRLGSKTTPLTMPWEQAMDNEKSAMLQHLNKAGGLGAYDNGTERLLSARVGDLKSVGPAGDRTLDQLEAQLDRDHNAAINANGGRPAARVYIDGKWRVVEAPPGTPGTKLSAPATGGVGSVPGAKPVQ